MNAQEIKEHKRVKIISETIDDNGKVTREVREAEGDDADALLKEMEIDINDEDQDINTEKRIETKIIKKMGDGEKDIEILIDGDDVIDGQKRIIIKSIGGEDGDVKIMEWHSDEDFPEGEDFIIEIDGDQLNDNAPHKIKRKMRFDNGHWDSNKPNKLFFNGMKENTWTQKDNFVNNNKASLGVMIEDTKNGVVVEGFSENSAAEKAGMRRGDVILKVENTYIFSDSGLVESLSPYNPNEKVKVKYLREGKEKSAKVTLKARN
jgi:hypothetical protein